MANILQKGLRNIMSMLPDDARNKAKKILEERILAGGELVSNDQFEARVGFCKTRLAGNPCEYFGPVLPGGIEFSEGCQACNCPMITKAHMKSITDPLMAQMFQGGATEIKCKHPEGNFWEPIDAQF
jgi:hypothetical protein